MTCQRATSKQLASINKLNEEKQLLEDMKNALNNSSNMNDFENRLKQLRTASLSRSVTKKRFNRFAETMTRSTHQNNNASQFKNEQFGKSIVVCPPSNEHIYESIENQLTSYQDNYYFNQKLNAYTNEANLIQTNDDWSCSTMNGVYDEKPLLLNRNLHSGQSSIDNYDDQHNLRDNLMQSSYTVEQTDELPDLLLKFKNESYS